MAASWRGRIEPDASGKIPVEGYNRFLEDNPSIARSPVRAAIEFVRLRDPQALLTVVRARASELERPDTVRVILIQDELPDDSIRSVRYLLRFRRAGGRRWEMVSARRTQRCQRGRGQQRYSPKPCR
jgi:hypothetical protein